MQPHPLSGPAYLASKHRGIADPMNVNVAILVYPDGVRFHVTIFVAHVGGNLRVFLEVHGIS
jgi:hypothetical protein